MKTKQLDCKSSTPEKQEDSLEEKVRERVREWIVEIVEEELAEALGAGRHARKVERRGYRNGRRRRSFTSGVGHYVLELLRGYIVDRTGKKKEWHSQLI
ncbi:MAG: transposase, partial [Candidatus Sumerlaeia bacterium]|nr:transposase [Candidatus Sumerlaeia bacterium]